jgi:hypothetical protein
MTAAMRLCRPFHHHQQPTRHRIQRHLLRLPLREQRPIHHLPARIVRSCPHRRQIQQPTHPTATPINPRRPTPATALLAEDRFWTATQLQEALAPTMPVQVHPATLTHPLRRMGYVYTRTRSVPAGVAEASAVEAFRSEREQAKGGKVS